MISPETQQVELPASRSRLFRPPSRTIGRLRIPGDPGPEWGTGVHVDPEELWVLRRGLRSRELALLGLLNQHRYLTTEDVADLLYPSPSASAGLRDAQRRLKWLVQHQLLIRVSQREAVGMGTRHLPSLFLLTQRGTSLLADWRALRGVERDQAFARTKGAAVSIMRMDHDLEVNAWFVLLASAARNLDDQGLWAWVGDDAMRENYLAAGGGARPDGWGSYLVGDREVVFCLEWDRGAATVAKVAAKVRAYVDFHAAQHSSVTILFVCHSRARELNLAEEIRKHLVTLKAGRLVHVLTSNTRQMEESGALGRLWRPVTGGERACLSTLPTVPRGDGRRPADCLGKPGWWARRPGGGEGDAIED